MMTTATATSPAIASNMPEAAQLPHHRRVDFGCSGLIMTPEEFDAIEDCDEEYRYELIRGVLVVSPRPSLYERDPNDELGHSLRLYRLQHPQGRTLNKTAPEHPIATSTSRRIADRAIWAGFDRKVKPRRDVPTIVIEFVSGSKRDRRRDDVEKRIESLAAGVREYWIFDRFDRELTIFRRDGEATEETVVA